jgi:ADP-heptose:LPS heptosyltransferase
LISRRRARAERPRILVIIRGHIADLLETTPALRALRDRYPQSHITAMVNEYTRGVLDDCPYVDRVIFGFTYERRTRWQRATELLRLIGSIIGRFDIVVCERSAPPRAAGLALISGARLRVGFDQPRVWGRLLTHNLGPQPDELPNREVNLIPLRALGIEGRAEYEPLSWTGRDVVESVQGLLTRSGITPGETRYAVYQVSCNWGCNELRSDKWADVMDDVYRTHGLRAVVLGSGDSFELAKFDSIRQMTSIAPISLLGETTLPEAFEVVRGASLAVMTDSALGQVAVAQGVPTVLIFGVEPMVKTAPLGDELERTALIQHWDPATADPPNPHCRFGESYCHSEHCRENSSLVRTSVEEIVSKVAVTVRPRVAADSVNG